MTADIDELERLHAETDGGEWTVETSGCGVWEYLIGSDGRQLARMHDEDAAKSIAATHNALPGLIAELRALREVAEAARAVIGSRFGPISAPQLRAALAKVPK